MNWSDCQANGRTDLDWDGLFDTCELSIAHDFRPTLNTDLGDDCEAREPYWALRRIGLLSRVRIFYAIGYHRDCGDPWAGILGHEGDSEFIVLDISFDSGTSRWVLDSAFLSAHYQQSNDHSRWYHHTDLTYGMNAYGVVHSRGRPSVVVAEGKHANYSTRGQCLLYERCGTDVMPYSLDIQAGRNLGSNTVRLVNETWSAQGRSGTEYMWNGLFFCGWSNTSCTTAGWRYVTSVRDVRMRFLLTVVLTSGIAANANAQTVGSTAVRMEMKDISAGAMLRVDTGGAPAFGRYSGIRGESLVLFTEPGAVDIPLTPIRTIHVQRTRARVGVMVGAGALGLAGAIFGVMAWRGIDDEPTSGAPGAFIGGVVGAGAGALVGGLTGSLIPRWVQVWPLR